MSELLTLPPASSRSTQHAHTQTASMHAKLIKADFHGAMISGRAPMFSLRYEPTNSFPISPVKQSKNPSLVGLTGIVILETENAFKVVTRTNQFKRRLDGQWQRSDLTFSFVQSFRRGTPCSHSLYHSTQRHRPRLRSQPRTSRPRPPPTSQIRKGT